MQSRITVRILPSPLLTRMLVTEGSDHLMKARLPGPSNMHPRATLTLLEAVALLYQQRIRVVLSADDEAISSGLGLTDGFGFGASNLHYEVEVLPDAAQRRRARRLYGLGDFRDVRRLEMP
jgi:hypothetical protein